jgi:NAD(P)-dependent dehydrogenase (short-subunit alcohol dehydrogenase family)
MALSTEAVSNYMAAEGRVALITGGASGIGRETARRLAFAGVSVVIADLQREMAEEFCAELVAAGCIASAVTCNVSKEGDVVEAVAHATQRNGHIDILVNVAGGSSKSKMSVDEMEFSEFNRVLAINLGGTFLFCKYVAPLMKARGFGRIINVTSTAALITSERTTPAYAGAKGAIAALTRQMVFDYSKFGVTINSIAPGHIRTPLALRLGEKTLASRIKLIPMGRLGEPADVAAAVEFLASPEASFITGQMLIIDGGQTVVNGYSGAPGD